MNLPVLQTNTEIKNKKLLQNELKGINIFYESWPATTAIPSANECGL